MQISVRTARTILRYLEKATPRGHQEEDELAQAIKEIREHLTKRKG
jgi:hypothetical protein